MCGPTWGEQALYRHCESLTSYEALCGCRGGGVDGIVHISELSWSRIRKSITSGSSPCWVTPWRSIISFDKEKKKGPPLGMKDRSQNPWEVFTNESIQPGDVLCPRSQADDL